MFVFIDEASVKSYLQDVLFISMKFEMKTNLYSLSIKCEIVLAANRS